MLFSLRRAIMTAVIGLALLLPAAAQAHSSTASGGGLKATLSYSGGPGITTRDERLTIVQGGKVVYDQPVPKNGCFKACGPGAKQPVAVADLYGNDGEDVVLTLFSGGADCCNVADVYVPSAAVQSYVLDQHDFGEAGFVLRNIGPKGRPEFVSADARFYCVFSDCAGSALPLQIFEFDAERFVNVTSQYPELITADAAGWLKIYDKNPRQEIPALIAWAADEYNLGSAPAARTMLQRQVAEGHLKATFEAGVLRFLGDNHYG
jgi:hypothetical protein